MFTPGHSRDLFLSADYYRVEMEQQVENTRNQLDILLSINREIAVVVNTPIVLVNTESRSFSLMFHQNPFIRTLNTASVDHNSISELLFTLSEKTHVDNKLDRLFSSSFMGFLNKLHFFIALIENAMNNNNVDDLSSSFNTNNKFSEEEKELYNEFLIIVRKHGFIFAIDSRIEFFNEIKHLDVDQKHTAINQWTKLYLEMIDDLKKFQKKVPPLNVYDSQQIQAKLNFLKERVYRMEESLSNLDKQTRCQRGYKI